VKINIEYDPIFNPKWLNLCLCWLILWGWHNLIQNNTQWCQNQRQRHCRPGSAVSWSYHLNALFIFFLLLAQQMLLSLNFILSLNYFIIHKFELFTFISKSKFIFFYSLVAKNYIFKVDKWDDQSSNSGPLYI
jgi:hypothetical protein